jgi:predicted nucleic acid-binding protein
MVVDALVIVDSLLNQKEIVDHLSTLLKRKGECHAPELIDVEVAQVIRRFNLRGELADAEAEAMLEDLWSIPMVRYPHAPLLKQAFRLRRNTTVYDGLYIALAESLDLPLLTRDTALAMVLGVSASIWVI